MTLYHDSATGTSGAYGRRRLRETTPDGTWHTTVMIRQAGTGPTWFQLDAEHLPDDPDVLPVPARTPGSRKVCSTYFRRARGKRDGPAGGRLRRR
ncbi:hypothetical protein [Streptomyces sp. 147326]|uniref:hypothetical protein n=1 Tax=Streptomyces sp. 147326 TaxID=3074379 RepID=UPI003857187F